jgi:hypothetical protein
MIYDSNLQHIRTEFMARFLTGYLCSGTSSTSIHYTSMERNKWCDDIMHDFHNRQLSHSKPAGKSKSAIIRYSGLVLPLIFDLRKRQIGLMVGRGLQARLVFTVDQAAAMSLVTPPSPGDRRCPLGV